MLELTHNWDAEDYGSARNFGHLAFVVDDIYATCARLQAAGVTINRPPRDGHHGFRPFAGSYFDRVAAEGRGPGASRAVGVDAEHRRLVSPAASAGVCDVAIVGAGPAGLFAAEIIASGGHRVTVYERMASPARKFLLAGRGGLNLTHSEGLDAFLRRVRRRRRATFAPPSRISRRTNSSRGPTALAPILSSAAAAAYFHGP